jgi:hypothetical protein
MRSRPPPAGGELQVLYRAVSDVELQDISAHQQNYGVRLGGSEGKWFYPTIEQAREFAATYAAMGAAAYSVTSAGFPGATLEAADVFWAAAEGWCLWFPAEVFPIGPVVIHERMP